MTSTHGKHYFTSTSQQTTNLATTNSTKLGAFLLPLPPLAEQDRILTLITESATRLDSAVAHLRSSVAMLQEYRQTLISAAVTGKIDVTKEADQDSRQAAKTPRKGEP